MKYSSTKYIETSTQLLLTVLLAAILAGCSSTPTQYKDPTAAVENPDAIPTEAEKDFQYAQKAMRIQNYRKAEKLFVEMTKKYPDLSGPYANLGIIYAHDGRDEDAEKQYKKALELNDENPLVYNQLGILYRQNGRFKEAESAYKKALKLDEEYANAHINLGILYDLYMGDLKKAVHHYKRYQELTTKKDKKAAIWILDLQRRIKAEMSKS